MVVLSRTLKLATLMIFDHYYYFINENLLINQYLILIKLKVVNYGKK